MGMMCNEEDQFEKYYHVEEHTKFHPGMYFENFGPTRIIGGEYEIITYLSLTDYNTKYNILGEKIKNITTICNNDASKEFVCAKHQDILQHLYDEITSQKEKLYLSLGKIEENTPPVEDITRRKKRGLINIVGTGMNTLFGICDDTCVQKTNEAVQRTEKNGVNILHILKSQTTVVKAAIKKIGQTMNKTIELYDEMRQSEKYFINNNILLNNKSDNIIDMLYANELQNMYTLLTNQYAYDTSTLNEIVTAARAGVIHTSLMSPQDMAKTMTEVANKVKQRLDIPLGTRATEIYQLQKVVRMAVYYSNDKLVFITKIPLITELQLTMYNAIPIPITNDGVTAMLQPEAQFIAITKDRKKYTTFTESEILSCIDTSIYRLCPAIQPIQEINKNQPCEIDLFDKPDKLSKTCIPKIVFMNRNIYHKLKYQNKWLYAVKNDTLRISCTDLPEPHIIKIKNTGTIAINDNGCVISADNALLTPVEELLNTKHIDFIPKTDINSLFEGIPKHNKQEMKNHYMKDILTNLTDFHDISNSLDTVEDLVNRETERQEIQNKITLHSSLMYFTIILAILSFILGITVYIMIKCKLTPVRERYAMARHAYEEGNDIETRGNYEFISMPRERIVPIAPPPPPTPIYTHATQPNHTM